jgi:hypothetical protein
MGKLFGKGVRRLIASLLIWFVFMILLMTAVGQQSVTAHLDKAGLGLGYTSAYATVREVERRQEGAPKLREDLTRLSDQLGALEKTERIAQGKYNDAWEAFLPILMRLSREPKCGIKYDPTKPVAYGDRTSLWGQAHECGAEHPDEPRLSFKDSSFAQIRRDALDASADSARMRKQVDQLNVALAKAENPTAEEAKVIANFRDVDVLRHSWLVLGGFFTQFPPAVLQLLLSASAGAFGALLITLILLVYPKTDLKFSTSSRFWERIMLGGFIAVCVYIVLLGGTAVLGTASFDQAGANYMTFCAISVLAGMFSDRVAHWLSQRADLFFKDAPEEHPATAPTPPAR